MSKSFLPTDRKQPHSSPSKRASPYQYGQQADLNLQQERPQSRVGTNPTNSYQKTDGRYFADSYKLDARPTESSLGKYSKPDDSKSKTFDNKTSSFPNSYTSPISPSNTRLQQVSGETNYTNQMKSKTYDPTLFKNSTNDQTRSRSGTSMLTSQENTRGIQILSLTPNPDYIDPKKIVFDRYNRQIIYEFLERIDAQALFNSHIIDTIVDLYKEAFETNGADQRVRIFTTAYWNTIIEGPYSLEKQFYSTYYRKKYANPLAKNQRGESLFSKYDKLGFVINIQNVHWIFAVIDNLRQKIQVYDSLLTERYDDPDKRKKIEEILKMYIRDEALESKVALTSIEAETLADCYQSEAVFCPLQSGTDCGPHVVKNIECLLLGQDIGPNSYKTTDIVSLRSEIKSLLLELGIHESKPLKKFLPNSKLIERFLRKFTSQKVGASRKSSPFEHIKGGKTSNSVISKRQEGNLGTLSVIRTESERPSFRQNQAFNNHSRK